jgi:DNA processing protein
MRSQKSGFRELPSPILDEAAGLEHSPEAPSDALARVVSLLSPEPTSVDDLVRRCHLSPSVTVAVLLELELAGRVETLAGSRVALLPEVTD